MAKRILKRKKKVLYYYYKGGIIMIAVAFVLWWLSITLLHLMKLPETVNRDPNRVYAITLN